MNNSLDKLIGNDELLTYICLILAILNTLLMSIVITDIRCNFNIYIFLLFEALFLIFIVYFLLKKKDVYSKDDDIKYDWYFYLRVSIITLVFFNFALYIYNISNDTSANLSKNGGGDDTRFSIITNLKKNFSITNLKNKVKNSAKKFLNIFRRSNKVGPEPQPQPQPITYADQEQKKLSIIISRINDRLRMLKTRQLKLIIRQGYLKKKNLYNIANGRTDLKGILDNKMNETDKNLISTNKEIESLENNLNELVLKLKKSLIERGKNAIEEGDEGDEDIRKEQETFNQQTANIQEDIDKTYKQLQHTSNKTENTNDNNDEFEYQQGIAALIKNAAVAPTRKYKKKELLELEKELDEL